ncbi:MAG: hypothetical protein AB8B53_01445 [Flavobacteriales bacterium]
MLEPQPSIELFGLILREPVTAGTDVLISIACLAVYFKLRSLPSKGNLRKLFMYHFLFMAIATFLGGVVGHALMHYLPEAMKLPGWIAGLISVALLERAIITYSCRFFNSKTGNILLGYNFIEFVTFLTLLLVTVSFKIVLFHTVLGILIVVTGLTGFLYVKEKSKGSINILLAVLVSVIGVLFFVFKIGLHKWFNHADIGHVFMILATFFYYKGAKDLIERD